VTVPAREQIFVEIDDRLEAIEGLAEYERMPAGDPSRFPALAAYDLGQVKIDGEVGTMRCRLGLTVEGHVRIAAGTEPPGAAAHAALNALHAVVVKTLCEDGNSLGGLVELIEETDMRTAVATFGEVRALGFAQDFEIEFATVRGDPTSFA